MAVMALSVLTAWGVGAVFTSSAGAGHLTVTAVSGSAYGARVVALSGGNVNPPVPMVTLPPAGGGPITDSSTGVSVGALTTGSMNVSTQGTLGVGPVGQATSSSVVNNASVPTNPPSSPPLFEAFRLDSQCTATAGGVTGSASFVGGFVRNTAIDFAPAPNTVISDPLYGNVILNEQIVNNTPTGYSIIVNAAHISRFPSDDIILGQSHCDTTFALAPPDTSTSTTLPPTSSTTLPPASSTTLPPASSTTLPPTSSTTMVPGDEQRCRMETATIVGTPGDDYLVGTPGNDVISGLGGNDRILGLGGDDVICGGAGDDRLVGGSGGDLIVGGEGADYIVGDAGADVLVGGVGNDRIRGGPGDDKLDGKEGIDECRGGAGTNTILNCEN